MRFKLLNEGPKVEGVPREAVADDAASQRRLPLPKTIDVYDFFSGCGGTSAGLQKAGLTPKIAVDFDEAALATYCANFSESAAILDDIRYLATSSIERYFERDRVNPVLMCSCAHARHVSHSRNKIGISHRMTNARTC